VAQAITSQNLKAMVAEAVKDQKEPLEEARKRVAQSNRDRKAHDKKSKKENDKKSKKSKKSKGTGKSKKQGKSKKSSKPSKERAASSDSLSESSGVETAEAIAHRVKKEVASAGSLSESSVEAADAIAYRRVARGDEATAEPEKQLAEPSSGEHEPSDQCFCSCCSGLCPPCREKARVPAMEQAASGGDRACTCCAPALVGNCFCISCHGVNKRSDGCTQVTDQQSLARVVQHVDMVELRQQAAASNGGLRC
jgi:hypothetical protein